MSTEMKYKELFTQWVALNRAIDTGAIHESSADQTLSDMKNAYVKEHNIDPEEYDDYDGWILTTILDELA